MTTVLEAFSAWLESQGYQPSTVQSTVRMVRRAEKSWRAGERIESYAPYLRRLVAFSIDRGVREEFIDAATELFPAVEAAPTGSQAKAKLTEEQWRALAKRFDPDDSTLDPYDVALAIILRTRDPSELRDVIMTDLKSLEGRDMPAHARKLVRDLRRAGVPSLLGVVCPGGAYDCAYKRLLRRLISRGRELEVEIDFHSIARVPWETRML